jgi:hypothetical protein
MGVVVFPSVVNIRAQVNAGYSMFDTFNGTVAYLNNFASGHDFATSLKGMDFIFNVGSWIYSQTTQFAANPVLAELQMAAMAEKFAKVGLPLDMASSIADMIVIGNDKGYDSEDFQNAAIKFALQMATLAAAVVIYRWREQRRRPVATARPDLVLP